MVFILRINVQGRKDSIQLLCLLLVSAWFLYGLGSVHSCGGGSIKTHWVPHSLGFMPHLSVTVNIFFCLGIFISRYNILKNWMCIKYIYMCVCVFVCVCVFRQHFFVNSYMIKQYRYPLSTHFCSYPFESPHRFYGLQQELINLPWLIGSLIFSARSWTIIKSVYIAKVMWPLHVHYYFVSVGHLLFILVCCGNIYFLTGSKSSSCS